MKKIISFSISMLLLVNLTGVVSAQTSTGSATTNRTAAQVARDNAAAAKLTNLKNKAIAEIDRRLTSLNNLLSRVSSNEKLSSSNRVILTTEIQKEVTGLLELRSKIEADTEMTILRADVKSIVTAYRVYALLVPKVNLILASERSLSVVDNMATISGKLRLEVDNLKASGKDTAELQRMLNDLDKDLDTNRIKIINTQNSVLALTPDGYPGNRSILQNSRKTLATMIGDVKTLRAEINEIVKKIRQMGGVSTPVATGSGTTR